MMEVHDEELCFPQLNTSCRKPAVPRLKAVFLQSLLSFNCVFSVTLNLLVIISVSHFRQGNIYFLCVMMMIFPTAKKHKLRVMILFIKIKHCIQTADRYYFCLVTFIYFSAFVYYSVFLPRQLHKTTNFLLLSLAISDFMLGLVFFPGEGSRRTSCWFLGDAMCLLYMHIVSMITYVSVINIVLISADRYVAICYPLHYHRKITVTRIRLCISLCWIYSALYCITFVKDGLSLKQASCDGECLFLIDFSATVLDLILTFTVPVTVIIVLYTRVFVVAVFQARAIRSTVTAVSLQRSAKVQRSELKAARTLGILVIVFLICFCPFYCAALGGDVSFNTSAAVLCLFCINSSLNPLIYAMFYPWFRKAIKHIVTLKIFQPGSSKANIM